jgi:hypothetical protein
MVMESRFPMPMTMRCYECGKAFDVVLIDKKFAQLSLPACGKVEVFDLGAWEKKAIAWNEKMFRRLGRVR